MPPFQELLTPAATAAWVLGALFLWLFYHYNVIGSFQPYVYDKRYVRDMRGGIRLPRKGEGRGGGMELHIAYMY